MKKIKLFVPSFVLFLLSFPFAGAHAVTVSWTLAGTSKFESVHIRHLTAELSAPNALAVTIPFTISGTATQNVDYITTSGPLTIPPGSTSASINIGIANDLIQETNETIVFTMGTPVNATLGLIPVHTTTIKNDD